MKNLRIRLFLGHLMISALVIGSLVSFILLVWYPQSLAHLEGTYDILVIMAGIDITAGPFCTLIVAAPGKSMRELTRDLTVIGTVQLIALGYAIFTAAVARPLYVVYSFGQFDITRANQLKPEDLAAVTDPDFASPPWLGPKFVEAQLPKDRTLADKIIASTINGGTPLKDMPQYYAAWPPGASDVRQHARGAADLWQKGELRPKVDGMLKAKGVSEDDAIVVPIFGQVERGTVILKRSDLSILGIVPGLAP